MPSRSKGRWYRVEEEAAYILGVEIRYLLWGILLIAISSLIFFVYLRMKAGYEVEAQLAMTQLHVIQLQTDLASCKSDTSRQLNEITTTVYGPLTSKLRRPAVIETWSMRRDKELRDRIRQLELWRYRQDAKK